MSEDDSVEEEMQQTHQDDIGESFSKMSVMDDQGSVHPVNTPPPAASYWRSPARSTRSAMGSVTYSATNKNSTPFMPGMPSPGATPFMPGMPSPGAGGSPHYLQQQSPLPPRSHVAHAAPGLYGGDGTRASPFVCVVNLLDPWMYHGFEIFRVQKVVNQKMRDCIHVRIQSDDANAQFKCTVPASGGGRVLDCEFPSIPHRHTFHHFEEWSAEFDCEATKQVIAAMLLKNADRRTHYMLIFPEDINFDNQVISNDEEIVDTKPVLLGHMADDSSDDEICGLSLSLSWEIALRGGNRVERQSDNVAGLLKSQLAKKKKRNKSATRNRP
jgi:hypothetical protein